MKYNYRSMTFIGYALLAFFALSVSPLKAQTATSDETDAEEYYSNYVKFEPEVPVFYSTRSALTSVEMHVLDAISIN
jgi:hypothetical protein